MDKLIFEDYPFKHGKFSHLTTAYLEDYPIVYILYEYEKKKPRAYIGQTVQVERRMEQHIKNKQRNGLTNVLLIGHQKFNQSATYNIETNLINCFIGDAKYELQNVSQTRFSQMHQYYKKEFYNEELFEYLWKKLQEKGIVNDSLDVIKNKDIYKISPYHELSSKQMGIKLRILDYCKTYNINSDMKKRKVFLIEGEAGTGKSVVLASLFNTIQDLSKDKDSELYKTNNFLLINHGEMFKTYRSIADSLPNLKKSHILKPTSFINKYDKGDIKADIVLVDEAHLLLSKEDPYNSFKYNNHLAEIIKRSAMTILIFDPSQVLRIKSFWSSSFYTDLKKDRAIDVEHFKLTDQFRMQGSDEIVKWINQFVKKKICPLPTSTSQFDFQIMTTPTELKEKIFEKNKKYGLSRIVSTFDYMHKKNGEIYLVDKDGLNMPWNTTNSSKTWAERPETVNEAGSIYTIQGFDLNYVGVVIGPSIDYDKKNNCLKIDIDKYCDTGAFSSRKDIEEGKLNHIREKIVLNSINVLMKRGIHGLYIYATNKSLREYLLSLQKGEKNGNY